MDVIKAVESYPYYHSMTGQSREEWEAWRVQARNGCLTRIFWERRVKGMVAAKVNQIIAAMTASCMSPQEIADKAGVSVNIVYRMRRGYLVKLERFGKVCRALGISPEQYIDYSRLEQRGGKNSGE